MCGISGSLILGSKGYTSVQADIQYNMLFASMLRGVDGAGFAVGDVKDRQLTYTVKEAKPAATVFDRSTVRLLADDSRWMIAHCRASTMGDNVDDACHPFSVGDIVGVHNGTVRTIRTVFPDVEGVNDSEIIYKALSAVPPEEAADVLKKLDVGAYALAWYDKRIEALRFARNSKRNLYFYRSAHAWWWASEPGFIAMALGRESKDPLDYMKVEPWLLATDRILTVPVNGKDATVEEYTIPSVVYRSSRPAYDSRQRGLWNEYDAGRASCSANPHADAEWWATEGGQSGFDGPHYNGGSMDAKLDSNLEEGWFTLACIGELWSSPQWVRKYRVAIYKALRWVFDMPAGDKLASNVSDFKHNLRYMAKKLGTVDNTTAICFNGQHVEGTGMVFGAVSADTHRVMPIVGKMKPDALEEYEEDLGDLKDADTAVPLFRGDLANVKIYCDGSVGFEVTDIRLLCFESKDVISKQEEYMGSFRHHPHVIARDFPETINWENWNE